MEKVTALNQTLSQADFINIVTLFQDDSENASLLGEIEVGVFSLNGKSGYWKLSAGYIHVLFLLVG